MVICGICTASASRALSSVICKMIKNKGFHFSIFEMLYNSCITTISDYSHEVIGFHQYSGSNKIHTIEVFNFKDKLSQEKFLKITTETDHLSKIFDSNKTLEVQTKKFIRRLNGFVHESFKKIKIVSKCDYKFENLYNKRRHLKSKDDEESFKALEEVEDELADRYAETMFQKIRKEVKAMDSEEGGFNPGKLWKLKNKLSPKHMEPPTAMKDSDGKLLTTDKEVKAEAVKHYKECLKTSLLMENLLK